jgi:alcohol dehydrogenase (NADP+)
MHFSLFFLFSLINSPNVAAMQHAKLNNGQSIPLVGLGTWKSAPGDVKAAVKEAIKIGYRHVDCAAVYGNEAEIGEALRDCFDDGICKREDLFVTSKLWIDSKKREHVMPALKESLSLLQIDYLDMYLIHWSVHLKKGAELASMTKDSFLPEDAIPISETWGQFELAVAQGLAKGIGVSNFSPKKIKALLEIAKIKPAINQVEHHPYLQTKEISSFCQENGIHVTCHSCLGSGDRPAGLKKADEPILLQNEDIAAIATKHACEPAQVLLRWSIQSGYSVLAKSVTPKRLQQNLDAVKVSLDDDDMRKIASLDRNYRLLDGQFFCMEGSPYTLENIWDGA